MPLPEQPKEVVKVWLTPEQKSTLQQIASEQHEKVSHLIRQAVAQFVAEYLTATGQAPQPAVVNQRTTGRRPREREAKAG